MTTRPAVLTTLRNAALEPVLALIRDRDLGDGGDLLATVRGLMEPIPTEELQASLVLELDGNEVLEVIQRVYGVDYDTALFGVFGSEPSRGSTATGTGVRNQEAPRGPEALRRTEYQYSDWRTNDLLTDLCNRGLLASGTYTIRLDY